jgi:hypothetical protein
MKVRVHMNSQSKGVEFDNVENAYTKDGLFCVYLKDEGVVYKYPMCNIWCIKQDYTHSTRD